MEKKCKVCGKPFDSVAEKCIACKETFCKEHLDPDKHNCAGLTSGGVLGKKWRDAAPGGGPNLFIVAGFFLLIIFLIWRALNVRF